MHSKSPSVMAFCLICLGILAKNMPKHLAGYYLLNSYNFSAIHFLSVSEDSTGNVLPDIELKSQLQMLRP